jgi:S1-C subfamily serine protease
VRVELRFLSGARTGQVEVFQKAYIGLGRHPLSDARFDAERDLDVSSRHAAIIQQGDGFLLRDLGSKNGTLVNGTAIAGDVRLKDGDVIGFGPQGPKVGFRVLDAGPDEVSAGARAAAARMSSPREQVPAAARPSNTARIAAEVHRQTRHLRRTTQVLLVLLAVSAGGFAWIQWRSAQSAREIAVLQARADSLNRAAQQLLRRFQSELQSLRDALRESQREAARLRSALAAAGSSGDPATVTRLRTELTAAEARQRGITDAATVDYRAIAHRNTDAVALVEVRFSDVEVFSGTAFAVDSQGTLVTNKHVLTGEDGTRRPLDIAVKFSGSTQWFRGRMIGVADSADIGVLRVDIRGGTPRVLGLAAEAAASQRGDPVAIIGYPLGEDLPMEHAGQSAIADPTLTVGTVSKVLPNLLQVDGYGAPGSSGSPIFNRDGRVVAVLYGGERESQGKIIYAVPVGAVATYLRQVQASH